MEVVSTTEQPKVVEEQKEFSVEEIAQRVAELEKQRNQYVEYWKKEGSFLKKQLEYLRLIVERDELLTRQIKAQAEYAMIAGPTDDKKGKDSQPVAKEPDTKEVPKEERKLRKEE